MRDTVRVPPWLRTTLWALRWPIALVVHFAVLVALLLGWMVVFPQLHYGTMALTMASGILYAPFHLLFLVVPLCTAGEYMVDTRGGSRVGWSLLLAVVPLLLGAVVLYLLVPLVWVVYIMYFATGLLFSVTAVYSALPNRSGRDAEERTEDADARDGDERP
ncbi:hypothetical protein [Nocardiopsis alborubida]|uniref:Uncharacterized protein n=1 Tax=Nocardiopsis alborubida TaxID=146802 RepID=A0A7X6MG21_9ACTN|nr:hypothetical protein [Nocardiopsis alborubida]NKZ00924.1 hypothetical protein [Nocardiopsis alborubida]